jgi:transmembrane sensor
MPAGCSPYYYFFKKSFADPVSICIFSSLYYNRANMSNSTIVAIIERSGTGALTSEEEQLLAAWLDNASAEEFHEVLDQCETLPERFSEYRPLSPAFGHQLEARLDEQDKAGIVRPMGPMVWKKWAAAAAAVIVLLSGATWFSLHHRSKDDASQVNVLPDVAPGGDGAILTLADGRKIVLDSVGSGTVANYPNITITKQGNGQLAYNNVQGTPAVSFYNTLTTPKGKKTSVILSDGTQVWLNAASSIKYPASFTGRERVVEITGEAYFEVAKHAIMPFIVKKSGSDYRIQVLGTSFNINTYEDEDAIRTTLLEGSVNVLNGAVSSMLKPGQQALVSNGNAKINVLSNADVEDVMAWKNGIFHFDRSDIQTVMRQLARWYDVDVEYKGTIARHFGGTISRNVNISQVLKMLELTGAVKFSVEGRRIVVMP